MIRILQGNMHRSKVANDLLLPLAYEKSADILLLSEQYKDLDSPSWYGDLSGTAAVWVLNTGNIRIRDHGRGDGFVWVHFDDKFFFSVYLTPSELIQQFRNRVDNLEDAILRVTGKVVMGGDFNAQAVEWGMPVTDTRGRYILEMAARTGLTVLNVGNISTFRRPGYSETIPDVSFASDSVTRAIQNWRVLEDYSGSDHQYIYFKFMSGDALPNSPRSSPRRWNTSRIDKDKFAEELAKGQGAMEDTHEREPVEALVAATSNLIVRACDASMPRRTPRHGKPSVYWWTTEISNLRKKCHRLRRIAQRARNRDSASAEVTAYKSARRELRRAINGSKARCWQELVEDINRDPWGLGYKLVSQKLGAFGSNCVMDSVAMDRIVTTLFPIHPIREEDDFGHVGEFQLFTLDELDGAVRQMKDRKAPGPDGIPNEVLKLVFQLCPHVLLTVFNACLKVGVFPTRWKVARLVLISKGKGDPDNPSAYRPLCMLDTAGKLLERLIRSRLNAAVKDAGGLAPKQYGFRAGLSTADAVLEVVEAVKRAEGHNHFSRRVVLLVTLDVKNAFNSARWVDILEALKHSFHLPVYLLRMIGDYLKDRALIFNTREGKRRVKVTSGAAQGSILGPDLWNIAYDSLLRLEMPDECVLVGYADDVATLIAARTVEQAQIRLNMVMLLVSNWMTSHGLSLALQKTEVVLLTKKHIPTEFSIRVGEELLTTKPAVKYLGLMVDCRASFNEQIRCTANKAAAKVTALSRLMANVGGPSSSKRRLLMTAVQSVLLYGAEVWAGALEKEYNRKQLLRVQRRGALRVASAYRTVSEPAVLLIAGAVPIDLLAMEKRAIYLRRSEGNRDSIAREERARTIQAWQRLWDEETRGRWTAALITNVKAWISRKHGEVGYYMTQLLSGHGYFRSYLHKIRKAMSEECLYCPGEIDDACHTFFHCDKWVERRRKLSVEIGAQLYPGNIVETMLQKEDHWNRVAQYARTILLAKKADLDRH